MWRLLMTRPLVSLASVGLLAIALNRFRRDFCGSWELATQDGKLRILTQMFGRRRWALPIVVAVLPK